MLGASDSAARRLVCAAFLLGLCAPPAALSADPMVQEAELRLKEQFVRQRLLEAAFPPPPPRPQPAPPPPAPKPGLDVLANNDPVIPNSRAGKPLKIGSKEYTRGLYCHAVSKVVVRLPGPGKTFSAVIGVDANNDRGVKGTVFFSVRVKDRVAFKSDLLRGKMEGVPVSVDLAGAGEFVLEVGDAGDGIGWDQSDWAEAKVVLADGKELWLGEMEIRDLRSEAAPAQPIRRTSELPLAFVYDGQDSDALLAGWPRKTETTKLDAARTRHTITWTDPRTALEVRCEAVEYSDFGAIEWTAWFRNAGQTDTPILENIQGLDAVLQEPAEGEFTLHTWRGDTCAANLYEPQQRPMGPGSAFRMAPAGGRGSNGAFPYCNIQMSGGGVLLAIGWPGQWAASFTRDGQRGLRVTAGQEVTRLRLRPGEQVRTPLTAMLFWRGDDLAQAQNLWRRWILAHNLPRTADGKLPPTLLMGNTSLHFNEMTQATEENQKHFLDRWKAEGVRLDYWWMDAGWYPCGGNWPQTGTWEPDKTRFPNGLRAVSDHAARNGVKTLVWFEPERVAGGTWIHKNHPEWLLGSLLNLGNPPARQWLTDHVDRLLTAEGISLYRQDFNMDPLGSWRSHDQADRAGMNENLHVQGYLAYWDELRRRKGNLIIDSCASGGRRNDLETVRRSVALHPTDYNYSDLTAKQSFHQSLWQWLPYLGSNTLPIERIDDYTLRSGYGQTLVYCYDVRKKDLKYEVLRRMADQWRTIAPCYYGDYYPLTPYTRADDAWCGWQFHLPEAGWGVVQAFRRPKCQQPTISLRLGGLESGATYEVTNLDMAGPGRTFSGKDLAEKGLPLEIQAQPGAAVVVYRRAATSPR